MSAAAPYHHGDLREALAIEALQQVRGRGADAVSLRAVALAVGVSPSAAYHHFPEKVALMQEVGHRGSLELDRRMALASDGVAGRGRRAAVARLRACGNAYIQFAVDEPHWFRHTFGPDCAHDHGDPLAEGSGAYLTLSRCLDDLARLGALAGHRDGLDLLAWTSVHGFASLMIDGIIPAQAREPLLDTMLGALLTPG